MTSYTGRMGLPRMGGAGLLTIVTLDAIPHLGVMLVMAALTGSHAVGWCDLRRTVTVGAYHTLMALMPERHGACRRRAGDDPHTDGGGMWCRNLVRRMTAGAIRRRNPAPHQLLVMAEVASARGLEGETRPPAGGDVAGQAGEGRMAFVGEGIGDGGGDLLACSSGRRFFGELVALAAVLEERRRLRGERRTRRRHPAPKHRHRVERHRGPETAALPDGVVAPDAIRRVGRCGVRLVTVARIRC